MLDKDTDLLNFGQRLRDAREAKGLSQQDLADKIGTSKSMISAYENGQSDPRQSMIPLLAKTLNISIGWLITGSTSNLDYARYGLLPVTKHKIPLLGEVACGKPILADEELETYIDPQDIDADFALRAKGDSMTGDNIHDGDVVYIRKQSQVGQGEIAVVLIEEEATLKHVYRTISEVQLVASNPSFAPIVVREGDGKEISILGKVVGLYRNFERGE